jgi:hypothetical protein
MMCVVPVEQEAGSRKQEASLICLYPYPKFFWCASMRSDVMQNDNLDGHDAHLVHVHLPVM